MTVIGNILPKFHDINEALSSTLKYSLKYFNVNWIKDIIDTVIYKNRDKYGQFYDLNRANIQFIDYSKDLDNQLEFWKQDQIKRYNESQSKFDYRLSISFWIVGKNDYQNKDKMADPVTSWNFRFNVNRRSTEEKCDIEFNKYLDKIVSEVYKYAKEVEKERGHWLYRFFRTSIYLEVQAFVLEQFTEKTKKKYTYQELDSAPINAQAGIKYSTQTLNTISNTINDIDIHTPIANILKEVLGTDTWSTYDASSSDYNLGGKVTQDMLNKAIVATSISLIEKDLVNVIKKNASKYSTEAAKLVYSKNKLNN